MAQGLNLRSSPLRNDRVSSRERSLLLRVLDDLLDRFRVSAVPLAAERTSGLILVKVEIVYLARDGDRRGVGVLAFPALVLELYLGHDSRGLPDSVINVLEVHMCLVRVRVWALLAR